MSPSAEELVTNCFDELQISRRFEPYVQKAEAAGFPNLAKLFRALGISEAAREALMRKGMVRHAFGEDEFFVCPHCGLIFDGERPEQCPADETPGEELIVVE